MDGKTLKEKLAKTGLSHAEIARRIGVSPQSFSQSLKSSDIKTGLLETLCKALGKDMSFFYDIPSKDIELDRLKKDNEHLHSILAKIKEDIQANEK